MAKDALLQLPTDIIHTVFDHLRDDKKSLATCSLVCKAWEPPTRSRLLRSVRCFDLARSFMKFHGFVTTKPHLASYILELTLIGYANFAPFGSRFDVVYGSCLNVALLARMLVHLPRLRRLYLVDLTYEGVVVPLPPAQRPSLDLLVFRIVPPLSHVADSTLPELLAAIALFSHIGHLTLEGDNVDVEHDTHPVDLDDYEIPGQVRIRSLELKHLTAKVLAAVTHAIGKRASVDGSLESVAVSIHDTYDCVPIIGKFLRSFQHSIQQFEFNPMVLYIRSDAECNEWDKLHLSDCRNLRTLTLSLELPPIASRCHYARKRCFSAYTLLLSRSLPSSTLEQLILRLNPDPAISSLEWADMDRVLCCIPSLKSVVIDLCGPEQARMRTDAEGGDLDVDVRTLAQEYVDCPGLCRKGILEFRVGGESSLGTDRSI